MGLVVVVFSKQKIIEYWLVSSRTLGLSQNLPGSSVRNFLKLFYFLRSFFAKLLCLKFPSLKISYFVSLFSFIFLPLFLCPSSLTIFLIGRIFLSSLHAPDGLKHFFGLPNNYNCGRLKNRLYVPSLKLKTKPTRQLRY